MLVVNCRFLSQKITGTQKFATQICLALKKERKDIVFLSNPNILQKEIAKELGVKVIGLKSYKWFKFFRLPSGLLWEQFILPYYINKKYPNATLLNLINLAPLIYENNAVVLHDIAFKRYPHFYKKTFLIVYNILIPIILKRAKKVFTVSQFSKSEILKFYKINKNKINVVYNAINITNKSHQKYQKSKRYILTVSSLEPRKNISKLIEAVSKNDTIKLIVVGERNDKVFNSTLKLDIKKNISFTGYVNDDKLQELYTNATAFIYSSLYEGFGIPPLEAQSYGIPVIVSDIEVFREIYGDSVYYIDPYDYKSILNGINKVMKNKKLQKNLIQKGYKNVQQYSWSKSAIKILEILCLKK